MASSSEQIFSRLDTSQHLAAQKPSVERLRLALDTPIKRTLAVYLHVYPYTHDQIQGWSLRLSQPADLIALAISDLTDAGIMLKMGSGTHALYALNVREGWLDSLNAYFSKHPSANRRLARVLCNLL